MSIIQCAPANSFKINAKFSVSANLFGVCTYEIPRFLSPLSSAGYKKGAGVAPASPPSGLPADCSVHSEVWSVTAILYLLNHRYFLYFNPLLYLLLSRIQFTDPELIGFQRLYLQTLS